MDFYGPDTITIRRAELVLDSRDNSLYRDWPNATLIEVGNCMVEPYKMAEKLNSEDNQEREYAATSIRVFVPPDTAVYYTDRLTVDSFGYEGIEFAVLGVPGSWHDLKGKRIYRGVIARAILG